MPYEPELPVGSGPADPLPGAGGVTLSGDVGNYDRGSNVFRDLGGPASYPSPSPTPGGNSYGAWAGSNNSVIALLDRYLGSNWGNEQFGGRGGGNTEWTTSPGDRRFLPGPNPGGGSSGNSPAPGTGAPERDRGFLARLFDRTAPGAAINLFNRLKEASAESWQSNANNNPTQPAWFQRGYQPPAGIQAAIARGDYDRAYGPSQHSLHALKIMSMAAAKGNPNNTGSMAVHGRFLMDEEGTPRMQGRMYGDRAGAFRMSQRSGAPPRLGDAASEAAYNAWLMQQPEYAAWLARNPQAAMRSGGGPADAPGITISQPPGIGGA